MHFLLIKLIFFNILILFAIGQENVKEKYPCELDESVILTENQKLPNGSYIYDNVLIPKNLTYNTNISNSSIIYGCICLVKECVPWCCSHKNQSLRNDICIDEIHNNNIHEDIIVLDLQNENNNNITTKLFKHFHYQMGKGLGCSKTISLNPFKYKNDTWHIFNNGTIYQPSFADNAEMAYANKDIYCLALEKYYKNGSENFIVSPYFCQNDPDSSRDTMYGVTLLISQPFMIITIIVYLAIPKLRNLHGKALACYLSSLSISYFCLAYILLGTNHQNSVNTCITAGYICYLCIMSAYFWLSAISFDLWFNFNNYDKARRSQNLRFLKYCGICYGAAAIYTIIAYIVQESNASINVRPGFGDYQCYLEVTRNYSAVIWLYGPLIIVISFNVIMFILTWQRIRSVDMELKRVIGDENGKRNLKQKRNMFHIFLRLFVIMGVSWIAEIFSYFIQTEYEPLSYTIDLLNMMQGLLIFLLFVFKKDIKTLLLNRYDEIRGKKQYDKQYSQQLSRTISTNVSSTNQL